MRAFGTVALVVAAALVLSGCVLSQTGAPRLVADESAMFTGTLNSTEPDDATYWFEYGTTSGYGLSTPQKTTGVGPNFPASVSEFVDGLTAGAAYHYRLCSDVPDDKLPQSCGADRVVTTTIGHDSVHGAGTYWKPPFNEYRSISIKAAADPGAGTVDGDYTETGYVFTPSGGLVYSGSGKAQCLVADGNIAAVGVEVFYEIWGDGYVGVVIQDNGPSGDKWVFAPYDPSDGCPQPSASWFDGSAGIPGDFVVHDG